MLQAAFAEAVRYVHSKGHVVCSDPNLQQLMWYNVAMDCPKSLINYALGVESIFSYVLRNLLVMSDHPPPPRDPYIQFCDSVCGYNPQFRN